LRTHCGEVEPLARRLPRRPCAATSSIRLLRASSVADAFLAGLGNGEIAALALGWPDSREREEYRSLDRRQDRGPDLGSAGTSVRVSVPGASDGYVGFRSQPAEKGPLREYLKRILTGM
jgi:hypothetical protein